MVKKDIIKVFTMKGKRRRKKCYLSGKMTGLSFGTIDVNFSRAAYHVCRMGFIPVNPFDNRRPRWMPYWGHLMLDILMLCACDAIFMQKNWKDSRGARIEFKVAEKMKKEIFFEK